MKKIVSIPVESERLKKLRRIAKHKNKTMTLSIEEWIDKLKKEKPSSERRGFIAILNDYTRYQALPGNAYPEALPP